MKTYKHSASTTYRLRFCLQALPKFKWMNYKYAPHCPGFIACNARMIIYHEFKVKFHYSKYSMVHFNQRYTNPGCQFAQATKLLWWRLLLVGAAEGTFSM